MIDQSQPPVLASSVSFGFRFDRDIKKHGALLAVRQKLVHTFAVKYAEEQKEELKGISIYPVARAGKSGSEVFYLDLAVKGIGIPERFIAKFQSKKETEEEARSARSAVIARLCSKVFFENHPTEDLGIVVYTLAASRDHIEFRGFFLDLDKPDDECAMGLRSTFLELGKELDEDAACKSILDDFDRYVNRTTRPLERVQALSIAAPAQAGIAAVAIAVHDIYERIKSSFNFTVHPYLVHGDLHARNLMLSQSNPAKTELIDFGWVHSGHPAKDFVLMECTLKYMLLTELLQKERAPSNGLYIQADRIEAFEHFLCKHGFNLPSVQEMVRSIFGELALPTHQVKALSRVYACLVEIRKAAGIVLEKYCTEHGPSLISPEQHYFVSFFLVTVGLLGYSEVDQLWAMIGLQTIGHYL